MSILTVKWNLGGRINKRLWRHGNILTFDFERNWSLKMPFSTVNSIKVSHWINCHSRPLQSVNIDIVKGWTRHARSVAYSRSRPYDLLYFQKVDLYKKICRLLSTSTHKVFCLRSASCCVQSTFCCLRSTSCCLKSTSCFLRSTFCCVRSTSCCVRSTSYFVQSTSCCLRSTSTVWFVECKRTTWIVCTSHALTRVKYILGIPKTLKL